MKFHKITVALMAIALMIAIPRFARGDASDHDDTDPAESDRADAVVERHAPELKKIPHVEDVEADENDNGEIVINVEVDKKKNVDEVARKVPSKIEGFAVDVVAEEVFDATGSGMGFSSDADPGPFQTGDLKAAEPTPTPAP